MVYIFKKDFKGVLGQLLGNIAMHCNKLYVDRYRYKEPNTDFKPILIRFYFLSETLKNGPRLNGYPSFNENNDLIYICQSQ